MPFLAPAVFSFLLALGLTPLARALAHRVGAVAAPKPDRWHQKATAMLGGIAIFVTANVTFLLFVPINAHRLTVLLASAFLFASGLIDDFFRIKPYQKLVTQVMGAAIVIYFGLVLPWTGSMLINMLLTLFWVVGITNAINLLDNMDGLAAGIAAISAVFLALNFSANDQPVEALMLAIFAASLLGFLVYNSHPATVFMGDGGSMFIGFFLATTALLAASGTGGRSRSLLPVLAVPVLILFIPIFDTTFVTLLRKLSGRAVSQGGRDHTSHRLVALGLSERRAVWMLYAFAALSGLLALAVRQLELDVSVAAIAVFTLILAFVGVYLARVKVYAEEDLAGAKPFYAFLVDVSYKRRIFEVFLDVILIILAYYSAYALLFGPMNSGGDWQLFLRTLPVIVFIKLASLLVMGVYRGIWRYMSIDTLVAVAKGAVLGSVGSVLLLLFAFRFAGFSRAVFVLDGMILFVLVTGSRLAFRLMRHILPLPPPPSGRRILIYGAGDGGELLLRELLNNRELQYAPVGFIDDDPMKTGKVIHGLRVFAGREQFRSVCEKHRIDEVVISSLKFPQARLAQILTDCETLGVAIKQMTIQIQPVSRVGRKEGVAESPPLTEGKDLLAESTHG